jgi:hypothetical protein
MEHTAILVFIFYPISLVSTFKLFPFTYISQALFQHLQTLSLVFIFYPISLVSTFKLFLFTYLKPLFNTFKHSHLFLFSSPFPLFRLSSFSYSPISSPFSTPSNTFTRFYFLPPFPCFNFQAFPIHLSQSPFSTPSNTFTPKSPNYRSPTPQQLVRHYITSNSVILATQNTHFFILAINFSIKLK